jgi:hypothetical protein
MQTYRVVLNEERGDTFRLDFICQAEDESHAEEQAENAYPSGEILLVLPYNGGES